MNQSTMPMLYYSTTVDACFPIDVFIISPQQSIRAIFNEVSLLSLSSPELAGPPYTVYILLRKNISCH